MLIIINLYFFIVLAIKNVNSLAALEDTTISLAKIPEDGRLNFTGLANKYGYKCDEYNITTEDNYILTVFNIPGKRSRPVYLLHGFLDSADTFIIRAEKSLALTLARLGYDVWVGNFRGNKYSRHHRTLNPDKDKKYWNFSVHEIGYFDQPATIDFILRKTSNTQLTIIGHSEGSTAFFIMGSTRPEYNDKVKLAVTLGPVAYLQNVKQPLAAVLAAGPAINTVLKLLGKEEFLGNGTEAAAFIRVVCTTVLIGNPICADGVYQTTFGRDDDPFVVNFLPTVIGHFPCGTSRKAVHHLTQIANRRSFSQYDYGLAKNLVVYKSKTPPNYDLSKVTMPVALFVGRNDKVSTLEDVNILRSQLMNVVEYRVLDYKLMNHIDFVFGAHMYEYLFPAIFEVFLRLT